MGRREATVGVNDAMDRSPSDRSPSESSPSAATTPAKESRTDCGSAMGRSHDGGDGAPSDRPASPAPEPASSRSAVGTGASLSLRLTGALP